MRKLLLTFINLLLLVLFFLLPHNQDWMKDKPLAYWQDFLKNRSKQDPEHRKITRWENPYVLSRQIANFFIQKNLADSALLLLPPTGYFKANHLEYVVPEPAIFYYYTGIKTVSVNSPNASDANWIVAFNNGSPQLISTKDKKLVSDSIASFKKYLP